MITKNNFIVIIIMAIAFGGIGFGISRLIQKPVIIEKSIDTKEFDHIFDSVMLVSKQAQFVVNQQKIIIDSLQATLKNKNQYAKQTKQIKNFTISSRNAWNDSVLSAAGLR